jgi:hypothetical protein
MDDRQVIEAFVNDRAQQAFGETLHIEGDVLILDGFWHVCLRVGDDAFIVRAEETPSESTVPGQIAEVLTARGLSHVASDLPGLTVLTMEKASLGYVNWDVWATDLAAGQAAVAGALSEESFFDPGGGVEWAAPLAGADVPGKDYSAEYHGARRLAGLPTSLVLTVGVDDERMQKLGVALEDCHFITKQLGEINADACCSLIPTLVLVNATDQTGQEFVMQVREAACGRVIPVVAVTPDASAPLGADAGVPAGADPSSWASTIRNLLP